MATNPYFHLYGLSGDNSNERSLVDGWVQESIQMFGLDVTYMPRSLMKVDHLFHEDIESSFSTTYQIEAYIESFEGFEGQGDLLTTFGLQIPDQLDLAISQKRFREVTGYQTPLEGDLIYFPLSHTVFEIKFVESENQFYPNGTLPTYKLRCELFTYSGESMSTGIAEVDNIVDDSGDTDPFSDNVDIENEGLDVLDFSEQNPFGMP